MSTLSILQGAIRPLPDVIHLHKYFEQTIATNGENNKVGLVCGGHVTSYADVNRCANAVARVIRARLSSSKGESPGGDPGGRLANEFILGVDVEPSVELVITLLAVLKLGAGYVPVDARSAINRVKYILDEAKPRCVLADRQSAFNVDTDTVWSRYVIINLNDILEESSSANVSNENLASSELLGTGRLLAQIYTSGSTGKPKGVRLCHRTAMNRICWQWSALPFQDSEVGCFKTSLLFVDSVVEIFSCILRCVPLVIAPRNVVGNPEAFVQLLETHQVTRLTVVPSMLHSLLFYITVSGGSKRLPSLNMWVSNSETLPPPLLTKFFSLYSTGKKFINLYGSTETMADVTCEVFHNVDDIDLKSHDGHLSIGRPMCNCIVYIVGDDGAVVGNGEVGEVCVSGFNVAAGYVNQTHGRDFMKNPFTADTDQYIFYRTGDFGRVINGRIIYEGRRDLQVKIRGQRVNISEIEKVINECSLVDKVVVLCHTFSEVTSVIVAYFVTTEKQIRQQHMKAILIDSCKKSLPTYMMPKFVKVDEIPLQSHTGKVDRIALRKLYEKVYNRQSTLELKVLDETKRKALNIIAVNLSIPRNAVTRNASFFELGGNSLNMISTIVQLKEYGLHIPIEVFSRASSIQDIIDHVTESQNDFGQVLATNKYIVQSLHLVPEKQQIIDILAESFVEKEPLDTLLGITKSEFMTFARSLYNEACKNHLSLVVLDSATGDIVGGDFLFDFFDRVAVEHHESMAPILSLFRQFEKPVYEKLFADNPGRLMFNFCLCVHKDLPHADQVQMCHLIEDNVLKTAARHGFVGVVTNNTNPATQNICEHFFGYEIISKYLVRDFVFNGRQVFSHAPEDYYIKMMIRYI